MPSDKPKVLSYLDKDEHEAFKAFQEENRLSNSEAVNLLIRNYLIENDGEVEALVMTQELATRLEFLESEVRVTNETRLRACEKTEKLEERLAVLQESVESLQKRLKAQEVVRLTDEQIAAVTGKSRHQVALWRNGLQKPRGSRTKEALKPYGVKDGCWVRKTEGERI